LLPERFISELGLPVGMSDTERKVRLGIGSAAAASAIFAPLGSKWRGVLTALAAEMILSGIYGASAVKRLLYR
jgi:hypothetical protein